MTAAPLYYIEPQHEPNGPGNGWDVAPSDGAASVFCVIRRDPDAPAGEEPAYESIIDSAPTRNAAAAVIARLTAARRLEDAQPAPPPKVKRASMLVRFLLGVPFVLAFWFLCAMVARLTSG